MVNINLRHLEQSDWDNLIALGTELHLRDNSLIIQQDDDIKDVFCLIQGRARIVNLQKKGTERIIALLGAYSFIGIEPYFCGQKSFSYSAFAEKDVVLVRLSCKNFLDYVIENKRMSFCVMRHLGAMACSAINQASDSSMLTIKRVARFLLIQNFYGLIYLSGEYSDELDITHDELASYLGVDRVSITNSLSELEKKGYICKKRNKIIIYPQKLAEFLKATM